MTKKQSLERFLIASRCPFVGVVEAGNKFIIYLSNNEWMGFPKAFMGKFVEVRVTKESDVELQHAQTVKNTVWRKVRSHPLVNGVGIAKENEDYVVVVNLTEQCNLPLEKNIDGVSVVPRVIGNLKVQL